MGYLELKSSPSFGLYYLDKGNGTSSHSFIAYPSKKKHISSLSSFGFVLLASVRGKCHTYFEIYEIREIYEIHEIYEIREICEIPEIWEICEIREICEICEICDICEIYEICEICKICEICVIREIPETCECYRVL